MQCMLCKVDFLRSYLSYFCLVSTGIGKLRLKTIYECVRSKGEKDQEIYYTNSNIIRTNEKGMERGQNLKRPLFRFCLMDHS